MSNRLKEDEKNERTIRNLLKLPENRRCINCNSLGPQYVCTNFSTFVCTTCSGIHREFTHRVKSISMAKFTSQEISALQGGGNASAKEIYLKEWDQRSNSLPDGSNVQRLRDFIKHVYVDRRYTGERGTGNPQRMKTGDNGDFKENKTDTYQSGYRSPTYEETSERRYDRPNSGGRSPGYNQELQKYGDYKKSSALNEVVHDWRRDDRVGNGRRYEDDRISDGGSSFESKSPDREKDMDVSSPSIPRPVREILRDNAAPIGVVEPPKATGRRSADGSVHAQRTASSSSLASSNGSPSELKIEASLIDFDAVSESPVSAAVPLQQQSAAKSSSAQQASSSVDNWANFDSAPQAKESEAPSSTNSLESLFSGLSVTALNSVAVSGQTSVTENGSGNSLGNATTGGQWSNMQPQQPSPFHGHGVLPVPRPSVGVRSSNQCWNSLVNENTQGPSGIGSALLSPSVPGAVSESTSGVAIQSSTVETKSSARRELPEDLFASSYSFVPAPVSGWHTRPYLANGINVQHINLPVHIPTFPQPSRSINPFDTSEEPSPLRASVFPPASSQGALPNITAQNGLLRTSSLGAPASHPFVMQMQAPSYASAIPPSPYTGQQIVSNVPQRPHGMPGIGIGGATSDPLNPIQQLGGLHSPASFNAFASAGGNPFD